MGFISTKDIPHDKNGKIRNIAPLKFRRTSSGACFGHVTKPTKLLGTKVDVQIDTEKKHIRLKESRNGNKVSVDGSFGSRAVVVDIVGTDRIPLTLSDDGWWYEEY